MFKEGDMPEEAPLMTFWDGTKWGVWNSTGVQATNCPRRGMPAVAEEWSQGRRRGAGVRLILEEFALHSMGESGERQHWLREERAMR